jgi:hypothetical protein
MPESVKHKLDDSWKEVFETVKTLDPAKLNIVKATLPAVLEHGEEITKRFYQRLLGNHPELKDLFNQTNQKIGHQQSPGQRCVCGRSKYRELNRHHAGPGTYRV